MTDRLADPKDRSVNEHQPIERSTHDRRWFLFLFYYFVLTCLSTLYPILIIATPTFATIYIVLAIIDHTQPDPPRRIVFIIALIWLHAFIAAGMFFFQRLMDAREC